MSGLYYPMTINYQRFIVLLFLFSVFFVTFNSKIEASVLDPQADYYRTKGLEEQAKGRYQSALNFYLKAVSMGPESPLLYNDIGIAYEQLGYTDRAEQYYLRILKVDPNYLAAYSNLAYLYASQGQTDKAKQFFMERLKRGPADDPVKDKIRNELYRLDPTLKASAIAQELEETRVRLAHEAQKKAQAEFALSVERAEKHYKRGENFRSAKKYKEAISEFDKALKVTPQNPKLVKAKERALYEERIDEVKQRIGVATEQLNTGEVNSAKKEIQQILAIIPKESIQNSGN
ncbi:MAG: tetratricopeptide repeat protein [Candidatus Omnitrophica bacterium]|nr:tetratricopeptide repeat protein [Candidatus Omnitrophota bacterium]